MKALEEEDDDDDDDDKEEEEEEEEVFFSLRLFGGFDAKVVVVKSVFDTWQKKGKKK